MNSASVSTVSPPLLAAVSIPRSNARLLTSCLTRPPPGSCELSSSFTRLRRVAGARSGGAVNGAPGEDHDQRFRNENAIRLSRRLERNLPLYNELQVASEEAHCVFPAALSACPDQALAPAASARSALLQ